MAAERMERSGTSKTEHCTEKENPKGDHGIGVGGEGRFTDEIYVEAKHEKAPDHMRPNISSFSVDFKH